MASHRVKPGQIVTGIMQKIFKKKYTVKSKVVYIDGAGKKDMAIITNYVEAYNKDQAAKLARENIFSHLSFEQEAIIAK